jgi:nicotinamidase-related amidase
MNIQLVSIDPQNDFVATDNNPYGLNPGSLCVDGGQADMDRLATFIGDVGPKLDEIHVTMDSHHDLDISHGAWFRDENGDPAPVFSVVTWDDGEGCFLATSTDPATGTVIATRKLWTRKQGLHKHTKAYLQALSVGGRYPHVIWPSHCLIGTAGNNVYPSVSEALSQWALKQAKWVKWVAKGSNPGTEHFSAVKAEVPQPNDPSTQVNTGFIQTLERADLIFLTGQALSHCVANTGRDIVAGFSDPAYTKKIVLLTDTTSNVTGFDALGDQFIADMQGQGMRVMTCADAKREIG